MSDTIPTDSVLRRHYEAIHGKPSENKQPLQQKTQTAQPSGGFLGWLKKVFCG